MPSWNHHQECETAKHEDVIAAKTPPSVTSHNLHDIMSNQVSPNEDEDSKTQPNDDGFSAGSSVPMKKRKKEAMEGNAEPETGNESSSPGASVNTGEAGDASSRTSNPNEASDSAGSGSGQKKTGTAKSRAARLEQNRRAARESRRRKKVMIEELQRSLVFFSRTNAALKQQNDDLTRRLIDAQAEIAALGRQIQQPRSMGETAPSLERHSHQAGLAPITGGTQQQEAPKSVQNSMALGEVGLPQGMPAMQPGSTMQAMANFQQALAAAMQTAAQGMTGLGANGDASAPSRDHPNDIQGL